jgi:hypothetical protein
MPQQRYVPLVCPLCGGILHLTQTLYACSLNHQYTGLELEDILEKNVRQTLVRTMRQIEQSQYLLDLMATHGAPASVLQEATAFALAHRLTKQLLTEMNSAEQ